MKSITASFFLSSLTKMKVLSSPIVLLFILHIRPDVLAKYKLTSVQRNEHWIRWPHIQIDPLLEDGYAEHFGEEVPNKDYIEKWPAVSRCAYKETKKYLKQFCVRAHEKAGRGRDIKIANLHFVERPLTFKSYDIEPRKVEVLSYAVTNVTDLKYDPFWYFILGAKGYITKGKRPDCVYYLKLLDNVRLTYVLHEHVCGIEPMYECDIRI